MYIITTPSRIIENEPLSPFTNTKCSYTDKFADEFMEEIAPEYRDKFVIRSRNRASNVKPSVSIRAEKPPLQVLRDTASSEEKQAAEERDKQKELESLVKREAINLINEMEIWLNKAGSVNSRRSYRSRIKHFLEYCKSPENDIDPVLVSVETVRGFVNHLSENGKSSPLIRSIISACKKFFMILWENHGIPAQTNPFGFISLLPQKERVKPLLVPDQADTGNILDYAQKKNPMVYAVIKFIIKHGMRIGAFEKMMGRGKKMVTKSKGKTHSFLFDDEDKALLEAHPLITELTSSLLGGRVNYFLKWAYENGVVNEKYSAHDFRHYFAVEYYNKHIDDSTHNRIALELSKKLGHSNVFTTEVYLESLWKESLQGIAP